MSSVLLVFLLTGSQKKSISTYRRISTLKTGRERYPDYIWKIKDQIQGQSKEA
jgi:hypothetical protein